MKMSTDDYKSLAVRLRIQAVRYYNKCIFHRHWEIMRIVHEIDNAIKLEDFISQVRK